MQKFDVDDDLAALVESLAKKKPFENLSFNDALRRVLQLLAGFSIRTNMGLRPRHGRWATRPSINDFRRERRRPWCQRALVAWW